MPCSMTFLRGNQSNVIFGAGRFSPWEWQYGTKRFSSKERQVFVQMVCSTVLCRYLLLADSAIFSPRLIFSKFSYLRILELILYYSLDSHVALLTPHSKILTAVYPSLIGGSFSFDHLIASLDFYLLITGLKTETDVVGRIQLERK